MTSSKATTFGVRASSRIRACARYRGVSVKVWAVPLMTTIRKTLITVQRRL